MAQRFSPPEEIQAALGLTPNQFRRAIRTIYKKSVTQWWNQHAAQGRYMIRQEQFERAVKGNITALKWIGIQHLGQRLQVEDTLYKDTKNQAPAQKEEQGFKFLVPEALAADSGDPQAQKPHDETPVVEDMLKEEAAASTTPVTPEKRPEIVVKASELPK